MNVAVVDIGTLKVKLLIAQISAAGNIQPLYSSNTLTCLGVRMHENNNQPQPQYLKQTIDELKRCQEVIASHEVKKLRVVSTHALREMGNIGKEIATIITEQVGFKVEIITQEEEAQLFFQAVLRDFTTDDDFTVVDVGGGSVQVLIGNKNQVKRAYLLKTGAQYLFDTFSPRHKGTDFPTREEIRKMEECILQELAPLPKKIKTPVIYGSSCIIDIFKSLKLKMEPYQESISHPYKVKVGELENFLESIIPLPYDERERLYPTQQPYYMWGIDKALLNILAISQKQSAPFIIPSNANINTGLVMSLVKQ